MAKPASLDDTAKPLHEAMELVKTNITLQSGDVIRMPAYIAGAPGAGKSSIIRHMCNQYDHGYITVHLALKMVEELTGIPQFKRSPMFADMTQEQHAALKIPFEYGKEVLMADWSLPQLVGEVWELYNATMSKNLKDGGHRMVVLHLQDCHLLGPTHLPLLFEMFTEKKIKDYPLPRTNFAFILDGNHGSNKAGAKAMHSAIVNRVMPLTIYASYDYWKMNFALQARLHSAVVSFLGFENNQGFFHEEEVMDSPWGSPRSWTNLAIMLAGHEHYQKNVGDDAIAYMAEGMVSKSAASAFLAYYRIFAKFDIPRILENAEKYQLSNDMLERYALAAGASSFYAGSKDRDKHTGNFTQLLYKYVKDQEDLALMMIHELVTIEKTMGIKDVFTNVSTALNKIEQGCTRRLLDKILGSMRD